MIEKALENPKLIKLRRYVEQDGRASGHGGEVSRGETHSHFIAFNLVFIHQMGCREEFKGEC